MGLALIIDPIMTSVVELIFRKNTPCGEKAASAALHFIDWKCAGHGGTFSEKELVEKDFTS